MKRLLLCSLAAISVALAQESRIELRTHASTILGTQKNFNIFLPEGYYQDTVKYPAVYLFRGHEREWANVGEDGSRRGNIKTVADRLYATGAIGKMILVMPGLGAPGTDADFTYVTEELIPYIDSHFRTIPVRQKRGMDGFSYGGYDMLQLLRRAPELFFTAGAYDGSFWAVDLNQFFASAGEAYWDLLRPMKFLIHSTRSGNYDSNIQFLSILNSHGITNAFDTLDIASGSLHNWYFADLHMEKTLPLHWRHLLEGSRALAVQLLSPLPAARISGAVPVRWSIQPRIPDVRTIIDYSSDRGQSWREAYSSMSTDTSFLWNTTLLHDGTGYVLRIRALGDTAYGIAQIAGRFTVDNPGNGIPEVGIITPDSNQHVSGTQLVQWWAEDADGDSLVISLDLSIDNGTTWEHLADLPNSGTYLWNSPSSPNSPNCRLRVRARDAVSSGEATSSPFTTANARPFLNQTLITHAAGSADGWVSVNVVDPAKLSGHLYRILFHDSVPGLKSYTVVDVTLGDTIIPSAPVGVNLQEGPLFDGLRLLMQDIDPPVFSKDSTRWITGGSNLIPDVSLPNFDPGTGPLTGVPYVSDYTIQLFDHTIDTSSSLFGWEPVPMNFRVWNVTKNHRVEALFTDLNGDRTIGQYDDLIIIERDTVGAPLLTWELFFSGGVNPTAPSAGDVFYFKILKPFTGNDVYEFRALPTGLVSVPPITTPLTYRLEQNYPNPFNPSTAIEYTVGGTSVQGAGASDVRLVVYDILGREVVTLVNERKELGTYQVTFNAAGMASGVYLYRLTAGPYRATLKMILSK